MMLLQELRSTLQNAELSQLVTHCEELSGTSLEELFVNIFQRVSVKCLLFEMCVHACTNTHAPTRAYV